MELEIAIFSVARILQLLSFTFRKPVSPIFHLPDDMVCKYAQDTLGHMCLPKNRFLLMTGISYDHSKMYQQEQVVPLQKSS